MDAVILMIGASFLLAVTGILFFLFSDRNNYKAVSDKYLLIEGQNKSLQMKNAELESLVSEWRGYIQACKIETGKVQEYCNRLMQQQMLLNRNQGKLERKMAPQKIEISIVGDGK